LSTKVNYEDLGLHLEELLKHLSISNDELDQHKDYLNITQDDITCLNQLDSFLAGKTLSFVDDFYASIMSHPSVQQHLTEDSGLVKLRQKQQKYFDSLTKANINLDYVRDRQRIGVIHQKIGLLPRWYIGAFSRYIDGLLPYIHEASEQDTGTLLSTIAALLKVVFLDMSLAIDGFHESVLIENDKLNKEIQDSVKHYHDLAENNSDWLWKTNQVGEFVYVNSSVEKLLGYSIDEVIGSSILDFMKPDNVKEFRRKFDETIALKRPFSSITCTLLHKDAHEIVIESCGLPVFDSENRFEGFRGISRDISSLRHQEELDKTLSQAIEQSADIVMICDGNGVIEYVNNTFEKITGYSREEVLGKTPAILKSGLQNNEIYDKLWSSLRNGQVFSEVIINRKKDNSLYYEEKTITPLIDRDSGKCSHFVSTGKDITERMDTENRLYFLMHHNAVSGLANRTFLKDRLEQEIIMCQKNGEKIAIFNLDLDRFKVVNDSLGHEAGDLVIKQVATRLQQIVNKEMILGHSGGGKFIIVQKNITSLDSVQYFAEKILSVFVSSFIVELQELFINASIGVSAYPQDGADSSELLRNAETAMNRAKADVRSSWQCYTADMNISAHKRLVLESELRRAIENQEFVLHYQPQIDFVSNKIIGFESLIRWNHPEKGLISPMEFIPVLEETGLIIDVGEWVLQTACTQNAKWRSMGLPDVTVAVNFSVVQFQYNGLVESIIAVLKDTHLPADALDVEITESIMMQDTEGVIAILEQLRAQGIQLSMDDFGTGYSSLSQLKKIPINTLKLDQSFVRGLPRDSGDTGITRAIISMGHNLGMCVIAEGVETTEQSRFLQDEGCDSMQGYLISRPVDVEQATKMLSAN